MRIRWLFTRLNTHNATPITEVSAVLRLRDASFVCRHTRGGGSKTLIEFHSTSAGIFQLQKWNIIFVYTGNNDNDKILETMLDSRVIYNYPIRAFYSHSQKSRFPLYVELEEMQIMDNINFVKKNKNMHGTMIIRKFLNAYPKYNKGMLHTR